MKKRIVAAVLSCSLVVSGILTPLENYGNIIRAEETSVIEYWADNTEEINMVDAAGNPLGATEESPILIESEGQLASLAKLVNEGRSDTENITYQKYFKLTKNLDLSGKRWTAIGVGGQEFQGFFDGNGRIIQGLTVDERTTERNAGLFGDVYAAGKKGAGIKNLTILDADVKGTFNAKPEGGSGNSKIDASGYGAILAASVNGNFRNGFFDAKAVIKNCHVEGKVHITEDWSDYGGGEGVAGGIGGYVGHTIFKDCTAKVDVYGGGRIGGFAGVIAEMSEVSDCTVVGKISGLWSTGGFVGEAWENSEFKSSYANVTVEAWNWNAGGFVGYTMEDPTFTNCVAAGDIQSNCYYSDENNQEWKYDTQSGGFIGYNRATIEKCYALGSVSVYDEDNYPAGGFAGVNAVKDTEKENDTFGDGAIKNCVYNGANAIGFVYNYADESQVQVESNSAEEIKQSLHEKYGHKFTLTCGEPVLSQKCKEGHTCEWRCSVDNEIVKVAETYRVEEYQWDRGSITTKPEIGKKGEKTFTCYICNETKKVILEALPTPVSSPSATPSATPSAAPSATSSAIPSVTPSATPTVTPEQKPSVTPTATPAQKPSVTPTPPPAQKPSVAPTQKPTVAPSQKPSATPTATNAPKSTNVPKKGTTLKAPSGAKVEVTKADAKNPEVKYVAPPAKAKGKVKVPATVNVDGVTYRVTSVSDKAFRGNTNITKIIIGKNVTKIGNMAFYKCKKLKLLVIKSRKLKSKNVAKNAFKGITEKTTIKLPKSKYKAYVKLLYKKGLSKKVKAIKRIYSTQEV